MSVLIKNGIIGTAERSFRGDLLIEDEKIAAVGGSLYCGGAEVIDAAGRYLLPGGVDPHTHVMRRAGENSVSDGFAAATRAALERLETDGENGMVFAESEEKIATARF